MMVSLSIFTLIAVATAGALLALIDANIKAQGLKSVVDNLNVALENMSRSIRFGKDYKCGNIVKNGECLGEDGISFTSQNSEDIRYYLQENKIYRDVGGINGVEMTAPEAVINSLKFSIFGAGIGTGSTGANDGQPRVRITINGKAGVVVSSQSLFSIQTTISQRELDL